MVGSWRVFVAGLIVLQCSTTMIDGSKCPNFYFYFDFVDGNCVYVSGIEVYDQNEVLRANLTKAITACHDRRKRNSFNWTLVKVDTMRKHERLAEIVKPLAGLNLIGLVRDAMTTPADENGTSFGDPTKWRWVRDGSTLDSSFVNEKVPWGVDEPRIIRGEKDDDNKSEARCAVLNSSTAKWQSAYCHNEPEYICESIDIIPKTTTKKLKTTSRIKSTTTMIAATRGAKEDDSNFSIALGMGIGTVLLAALIVVIFFVVRRKILQRRKRRFLSEDPMVFSATSEQSGVSEDVRKKSGRRKKSDHSLKSSNTDASEVSEKRETPPPPPPPPSSKQKGSSVALKKLYERWAAADAVEANKKSMETSGLSSSTRKSSDDKTHESPATVSNSARSTCTVSKKVAAAIVKKS